MNKDCEYCGSPPHKQKTWLVFMTKNAHAFNMYACCGKQVRAKIRKECGYRVPNGTHIEEVK